MAITRSATALLPATDLVAIRTRLAEQYGSELYEADDDRRILCIHVPRAEPDPVNDVEAAVEYLDPIDVAGATQVLLIGTQHMAQVYAEPLKQLVADRVRADHRIADEWRKRLPGTLTHEFFKDPADPRRRWRLLVRLPVGSMAEVEDDILEPLADELGPQVDTPRVKSLAAVYLVSARDHVRLAPDVFIQELLRKWRDEDRRMRAQAARELEKQAERDRKDTERRRLMAELDRTLRQSPRVARAPLRRHRTPSDHIDAMASPARLLDLAPGTRLTPRDRTHADEGPQEDGPRTEDRRTATPPTGSDRRPTHATPSGYASGSDAVLDRMATHRGPDDKAPAPAPWTPPARDFADLPHSPGAPAHARGPSRQTPASGRAPRGEALLSTDDVIQAGTPTTAHDAPFPPLGPSFAAPTGSRHAEDTPAASRDAGLRGLGLRSTPRASPAPVAERAVAAHQHSMERIKNRLDGLGKRASELHDRPGGRLGRIAQHLMDCGFDVLVRPETPGPRIDLAAERPHGDPQRIVLRVEDRLDVAAANKALELARTLDVDQVVIVAETAEPEAERRFLATKVQWLTPTDLAQARL